MNPNPFRLSPAARERLDGNSNVCVHCGGLHHCRHDALNCEGRELTEAERAAAARDYARKLMELVRRDREGERG